MHRRRRTAYLDPSDWVHKDLKYGDSSMDAVLHNLSVMDSRLADIRNDLVTGRLQSAGFVSIYLQHISEVLQVAAYRILNRESELNEGTEK